MSKKEKPRLIASRAAEVFQEMLSFRRAYCEDSQYFRMSEFWEWLAEGDVGTKIKTYKSSESESYKRKAGVVAFEDSFTLVVDEQLMSSARKGCKLSNFILAHEFSHTALDHHARGAVIKHFQLFASPDGMANIPPTDEELETNFAAIFFQCGIALLDPKADPIQLANRAFSDVHYVKKALRICRLDVFLQELNKPKPKIERIIL